MFFVVIICPVRYYFIDILFPKVELFMACLCIHNHLTFIKLSSGDLVGRNTRCIVGWCLTRVSFTLLDLCIYILSNIKNICFTLESYFWSTLFIKSRNCFRSFVCRHMSISGCWYDHNRQTHLEYLLSWALDTLTEWMTMR